MDWNIDKYGYIGTWILWIYHKYQRNINGYFEKNIDEAKMIQNSQECLKKLQKKYDKISK